MFTVLSRSHFDDKPRCQRTLIPSVVAFIGLWLVLEVFVQTEDYADGTWKDWPEQVPVYLLTFIWVVSDFIWWFFRIHTDSKKPSAASTPPAFRDEEDATQTNNESEEAPRESPSNGSKVSSDEKRIEVPLLLWTGFLALLVLHIGTGIYYSVLWAEDEQQLGQNDWGTTNVMSKASGHWITLSLLSILILLRFPRWES